MYDLIDMGGLKNGGINFDPKDYGDFYTKESILKSLFYAQEILAWAFRAAAWLKQNQILEKLLDTRYMEIWRKDTDYHMEQVWDKMKNQSVTLGTQFYTEKQADKLLEQAIEKVCM